MTHLSRREKKSAIERGGLQREITRSDFRKEKNVRTYGNIIKNYVFKYKRLGGKNALTQRYLR